MDNIAEDSRPGRPGSGKGPGPLGKRDQKKKITKRVNLENIEGVWCIYFGFISLPVHFEVVYQMEPMGQLSKEQQPKQVQVDFSLPSAFLTQAPLAGLLCFSPISSFLVSPLPRP